MPDNPHRSARLADLKIDRDAPPDRRGVALAPILVVAVLSVIAGIAALGFYLRPPSSDAQAEIPVARESSKAPSPAQGSVAESPTPSVLDATGYVIARRQATVSAKVTGKVSEILVEEGTRVTEGQVIARLDDGVERAELALARARLDAARAAIDEFDVELAHASRMLTRTRTLADRSLVSQTGLEEQALAAAALGARRERGRRDVDVAARQVAVQEKRLDDMIIRAPFAGVVIDKAAQPGEMVSPISAGGGFTRTGLGTIVDMDSLEVEVDVNEAYINRVRARQPATVTLNAYPARPYRAEVLTVVPAADRGKATVAVRVALLDLDERVLPNMGVRVAFLTPDLPANTGEETNRP